MSEIKSLFDKITSASCRYHGKTYKWPRYLYLGHEEFTLLRAHVDRENTMFLDKEGRYIWRSLIVINVDAKSHLDVRGERDGG